MTLNERHIIRMAIHLIHQAKAENIYRNDSTLSSVDDVLRDLNNMINISEPSKLMVFLNDESDL